MSKGIKKQIEEDTCICQKCGTIVPGSQADWQLVVGTSQMGNVCKVCQRKWAAEVVIDNVIKTKPPVAEVLSVTKTSAPGTLINNKKGEQFHFVPQNDGSGARVGVIFTSRCGCSRMELTSDEARLLWVTLKAQGFVRF